MLCFNSKACYCPTKCFNSKICYCPQICFNALQCYYQYSCFNHNICYCFAMCFTCLVCIFICQGSILFVVSVSSFVFNLICCYLLMFCFQFRYVLRSSSEFHSVVLLLFLYLISIPLCVTIFFQCFIL